jgi:CheY-like chemotaxis protein
MHEQALMESTQQEKKVVEELIVAKEKAEESDKLKSEFINNMSHEVRTPMNGILGFTELLCDTSITEEVKMEYAKIVKNSSNRLMRIIDDIMEISRLGTNRVKIIEQEICLNELLDELYKIFETKAKENNIKLYLKKHLSNEESLIMLDEIKLNKILGNLLENAFKFTNKGFVELGYNLKGDNIELYVKDTGIGIRSENLDLIFNRFSQEEKVISRKVDGLGLGLSIAKENTELLGGKIRVESEKGKGSTFFVTIPYKHVLLYKNKKHTDIELQNNVDEINNDEQKHTVLIVEDEEINYQYIRALVKKFRINADILYAENGKQAVDICKIKGDIDLIFMDIRMPIMDGYKATKLIKNYRHKIAIIAQTAYSTKKDKEKAIIAGCDDFISKPINEKVFLKMINKFL